MSVLWIDLPNDFLAMMEQPVMDLERLSWQASDYQVDRNTLPLALRHGGACTQGIVVPAAIFVEAERPAMLNGMARGLEGRSLTTHEGTADLMEALMPGWKAHGKQLDADILKSMQSSAVEAQQELEELLSAPVKPALVAHWDGPSVRI